MKLKRQTAPIDSCPTPARSVTGAEQYREWAKNVEYKPGHRLIIEDTPYWKDHVLLVMEWKDAPIRPKDSYALKLGDIYTIRQPATIPTGMTEDQFYDAVRWLLRDIWEVHEADEWLLIKGERRWDPHGPNAAPKAEFRITLENHD